MCARLFACACVCVCVRAPACVTPCPVSTARCSQAEMKLLDKSINVEREKRKQEYAAEVLRQKIEADNARTAAMAAEKARMQKVW